ncbi:MAG: hypothetical protein HZB38_01640 [Planctomycetes bacterium]|nr:hypothetical protein [Planctomycetota bacterium]
MRAPHTDSFHLKLLLVAALAAAIVHEALARNTYRREFFDAYPQATNTRLDRIGGTQHCGVCHYDFNGGGTLNPYGLAVQATPNRTAARISAK